MKRFFLLLSAFLACLQLLSQEVDFSVDYPKVCPGDLVQFTNKSTGVEGLEAHWYLDENEESIEIDASMRYAESGPKTVSLKYLNAQGSVVAEKTIAEIVMVYEAPIVSISASTETGCRPLTVDFDYTVESAANDIEFFKWEFNDGSASDFNKKPSHVFDDDADNTYEVTLYVEDKYGCSNGETFDLNPLVISAFGKASSAEFTMTENESCQESHEVSFQITKADSDIKEYKWDFGDGTTETSSDLTISHTYNGFGTYYPQLVVANEECESSAIYSDLVRLKNFEASILVKDTVKSDFFNPESEKACAGELKLYGQASSGGSPVSYEWIVNGIPSGNSQVISLPSTEGTDYDVLLKASNGECSAETNLTVGVEEEANITVDLPNFLCMPTHGYYTASSQLEGSSFVWDLSGFAGIDPDFPLHEGASQTIYFTLSGLYEGTITATSANSCVHTVPISTELHVFAPDLMRGDNDGCLPFEAKAWIDLNNYAPITVVDTLKTVVWKADGQVVESGGPEKGKYEHLFEAEGKHDLSVELTTELGCKSSLAQRFYVGKPLPVKYVLSDTILCAQQSVVVELESPNFDLFTSVSSMFINKVDSINIYTDRINYELDELDLAESHSIYMDKDTGWYNYSLDIRYFDCPADVEYSAGRAYVYGPIVDFVPILGECGKTFTVKDSVIRVVDADQWSWAFGDGTLTDPGRDSIVSHSYDEYRVYIQSMIAETEHDDYGKCTYVKSRDVPIRTVNAELSLPENVCAGMYINNTVTADDGIDDVPFTWYYKRVGGDTLFNNEGSVMAIEDAGEYMSWIAVENVQGCKAYSDTSYIKVLDPHARYGFDTLGICPEFSLRLKDISDVDTQLVYWKYMMIQESLDTLSEDDPDTLYFSGQNPEFRIHQDSSYKFVMMVRDALGCVDTTNSDSVIGVVKYTVDTSMYASPKVCFGTEINTLRANSGADYIEWHMGDGIVFTEDSLNGTLHGLQYTYQDTGSYEVKLVLKDTLFYTLDGVRKFDVCGDSATRIVDVRKIAPKLVLDKTKLYCKSSTSILKESGNKLYTAYEWYKELPDGSMEYMGSKDVLRYNKIELDFDNRNGEYQLPGNYKVSMIVSTDYKGCESLSDSTSVYLGTYDFEIAADKYDVCLREDINFYLTKNDNVEQFPYYWFLDDGKSTEDVSTSYAYEVPGLTKEVFFVLDFKRDSTIDIDRGKCPPLSKSLTINIKQEYIKFSRGVEDTLVAGCPPFEVNFVNESKNVNNFKWTFGDGEISTEENPVHVFKNPDEVYTVTLESDDPLNCKSADVKPVTTYPVPEVVVSKDTVLCLGESVDLSVDAVNQDVYVYSWNPKNYVAVKNDLSAISVTPDSSVFYELEGLNSFGCFTADSVFVGVIRPPVYTGIENAHLIIYDTLKIENDSLPEYIYQWSPSEGLSCSDCASPVFWGTEPVDYTLLVKDTVGCFEKLVYVSFDVEKVADVSLPKAFTPNRDGSNDMAFARGWGIKELISLQIFNRWGQLVFETTSMGEGWDGTFKGKPQPTETYTWMLKAKFYNDEIAEKKGYISLLR